MKVSPLTKTFSRRAILGVVVLVEHAYLPMPPGRDLHPRKDCMAGAPHKAESWWTPPGRLL